MSVRSPLLPLLSHLLPLLLSTWLLSTFEIFDLGLKFCVSIGGFLRDYILVFKDFPGDAEVKASACNVGDLGSIPESGKSPGEGNGNPLQYPCLENPMNGKAWWATVHGVAKSRTRLSELTSVVHNIPL